MSIDRRIQRLEDRLDAKEEQITIRVMESGIDPKTGEHVSCILRVIEFPNGKTGGSISRQPTPEEYKKYGSKGNERRWFKPGDRANDL